MKERKTDRKIERSEWKGEKSKGSKLNSEEVSKMERIDETNKIE